MAEDADLSSSLYKQLSISKQPPKDATADEGGGSGTSSTLAGPMGPAIAHVTSLGESERIQAELYGDYGAGGGAAPAGDGQPGAFS